MFNDDIEAIGDPLASGLWPLGGRGSRLRLILFVGLPQRFYSLNLAYQLNRKC